METLEACVSNILIKGAPVNVQQGSIWKKNQAFSLHHMLFSWQSLNHIFIINRTLRTHSSTVMLKLSISCPMSSQHATTISQTLFSDSMFFIDTSICYPQQKTVNGPHNRQNSFCTFYIRQKLDINAGLVGENRWGGRFRKYLMKLANKDQYASKRTQRIEDHRD